MPLTILVILAVVVCCAVLVQVLRSPPRFEPAGEADAPSGQPRGKAGAQSPQVPRAAVVVNPTKLEHPDEARQQVERAFAEFGWGRPLWLETTEQDTGNGQARIALAQEADLVVAYGGDGTVRTVADVLSGTDTPMALVPAGTGNLLARNLGIPLTDVRAALRIAVGSTERRIDVGRLRVYRNKYNRSPEEHAFLVMVGLGFDAAMMAGAPHEMKARIGPAAYVFSGLRNLKGPQTRVRLQLDEAPPVDRRVSTVVVGNCGKLVGGLVLMPDAEVDDGWLDAVSLSPKGIVGWTAVAGRVITKARRGHPRVEHYRAKQIVITAESSAESQVDGDPIGRARRLAAGIDAASLRVRTP